MGWLGWVGLVLVGIGWVWLVLVEFGLVWCWSGMVWFGLVSFEYVDVIWVVWFGWLAGCLHLSGSCLAFLQNSVGELRVDILLDSASKYAPSSCSELWFRGVLAGNPSEPSGSFGLCFFLPVQWMGVHLTLVGEVFGRKPTGTLYLGASQRIV